MSADKEDDKKPFDKFELVTAILLGLTAIGAAIAGQQGGQWGGRQLEAFSAANSLTTKAATQYTEDTVLINADYAAVAAAKGYILAARDANSAQDRERNLDMASYQYIYQMSELGYESMGLPKEYYEEDEEEEAPQEGGVQAAANTGGEAGAEATEAVDEEEGDDEDPEVVAATAMERDLPDEILLASLQNELDEDYIDKALTEGTQMFADADKRFEEGRAANENGDKFDLAVVFYTVALFFAGLGLVFKTSVRWGFFGSGLILFVGTTLFMITLPWAV